MRYAKNTAAVLLATLMTGWALWLGISAADLTAQGATYQTVATASGTQMVCPSTGCTSSTCHGATGDPAPSSGAASGLGGGSAAGATTDPGSGATATGSQAQTCPRTGCSATSCHGATGSPPPGGGGYGRGHRGGAYRPM
jgi:hypothetical protein